MEGASEATMPLLEPVEKAVEGGLAVTVHGASLVLRSLLGALMVGWRSAPVYSRHTVHTPAWLPWIHQWWVGGERREPVAADRQFEANCLGIHPTAERSCPHCH